MRALFLVSPGAEHNDNHERIPQAFQSAGWHVECALHESLSWTAGELSADQLLLADFDLIWPIGFGPAQTYLDRTQILLTVPVHKMISSPIQQANLHTKAAWLDYGPLSMVSSELKTFADFMHTHHGEWVLKPLAGSFGQQVFKVCTPDDLAKHVDGQQYWLLQRFIEDIKNGETRTLIVEGTIIGSYLRRASTTDFRTNLSQSADVAPTTLSAETEKLVLEISQKLIDEDIGFAAIDTCGGYVVEVNVANPGGLATLADVYHQSFDQDLVSAINARFS